MLAGLDPRGLTLRAAAALYSRLLVREARLRADTALALRLARFAKDKDFSKTVAAWTKGQ